MLIETKYLFIVELNAFRSKRIGFFNLPPPVKICLSLNFLRLKKKNEEDPRKIYNEMKVRQNNNLPYS